MIPATWFPEPVRDMGAWNAGSSRLPAPDGEVHLWRVPLTAPDAQVRRLARSLSRDERARADGFHRDGDRRKFVIGRGSVRDILGTYLHRAAPAVVLEYGAGGKPRLPDDHGPDLRFNTSGSGDLALIVVTRGHEVGVDIEAVRPIADLREVARAVFSARERGAWRALPQHAQEHAFFRAWTRKEAFLKGIGTGLGLPPTQVEVSLTPRGRSLLIAVEGDALAPHRWSVRSLDVGSGYVAALAIDGCDAEIRGARANGRPATHGAAIRNSDALCSTESRVGASVQATAHFAPTRSGG